MESENGEISPFTRTGIFVVLTVTHTLMTELLLPLCDAYYIVHKYRFQLYIIFPHFYFEVTLIINLESVSEEENAILSPSVPY